MTDRYEVSKELNNNIIGFMEGSTDGVRRMVFERLKRKFDMPDLMIDNIKVIIDNLSNPNRCCWSIHVDYNGEHYESVIRNLKYDDGCED